MLKSIITKDNLLAYAAELKKKKGKPRFDGMSADGALDWLTINNERDSALIYKTADNDAPAVDEIGVVKGNSLDLLM